MDDKRFYLNDMSSETIGLRPKKENIGGDEPMEVDRKKIGNFNFLHSQIPSTSQISSLFPTPAATSLNSFG